MQEQLEEWGYSRQERLPVAMAWMGMPAEPETMPADDGDVRHMAARMAENQRTEITELEAAQRRAQLPDGDQVLRSVE